MERKYKSFVCIITNEKTGESVTVESLKDWIEENLPYNVVYIHRCEFCGKIIQKGNVCSVCWEKEGL